MIPIIPVNSYMPDLARIPAQVTFRFQVVAFGTHAA